jgi:alpha-amylase
MTIKEVTMFKLSRLALTILPALLAGAAQAATPQTAATPTAAPHPLATSTVTPPSTPLSPLYLFIDDKAPADSLQFSSVGNQHYRLTTRLAKGSYRIQIADKAKQCGTTFGPAQAAPLPFGKANPLGNCAGQHPYQLRVLLDGDYDFTLDNAKADAPTLTVLRATHTGRVKRALPEVACHLWRGGAVTASVGKAWPDGTWLRDAYSGQQARVTAGQITLTPAPGSEGILLLAPVSKPVRASFNWDNATVYFMLTDRFNNGDKSNDHSFGRRGDGKHEIGTWHGGDLQGIIDKLDYIQALGSNVIWISPMMEQIHGFIGGGAEGSFPFYGYHGYWPLDFTRIDPNFGDEATLRTLVAEAHKRGIRVLLDVIMNHVGYANLADLQDVGPQAVVRDSQSLPARWSDWRPQGRYGNWHGFSSHIDYQSAQWSQWWGPEWVRAELPGYPTPGKDEVTTTIGGLPDLLTESTRYVGLPPLLKHKADTNARELPHATVSDYLVQWHTDWVRRFGIDGFRADTVKHVEPEVWAKLKTEATAALAEWKAAHPQQKLDDLPFFMVGEVWQHGVARDNWYDYGFDSLINFDYQLDALANALCMNTAEPIYAKYAKVVSEPGVNILSYISSHDTKLFFGDFENIALQRRMANSFMLLPGGVQIYYGDESGRGLMADDGVFDQASRSDMNWQELAHGPKAELVAHWQKLGQFRQQHPAIAAGSHSKISDSPYAFLRQKGNDTVLIVYAGKPQ